MEVFEISVRPYAYELNCPNNRRTLGFPTLLSAFAFAQLSMSKTDAEMVIHSDGKVDEHVPLYRMTP